ncbi:MAG: bifunctional serine/threonine-protein kinase/formylglycine-generating enzyme family protein [Planctomycetota bacterium]|jgi:formylglycine-generating enzyme required for sulfatase activity
MAVQVTDLLADPLLEGVPVRQGRKILGDVALDRKLGQGGMGAVYRGRHLRLDVDVALKVMAPPAGVSPSQAENFIQRFVREARVSAGIRHQNLIRVIDVNAEAGLYYLIMDYVDGESAGDRIARKEALREGEAVEIVLGAAQGLAEAHYRGIVHRDVKPDNILIDREGKVVVVDLGLAKAFSAVGGDTTLSLGVSMSQQVIGTPAFMAPEQTMSSRDVGPPADVWSLAATLYQLVVGDVPWSDTDVVNLMLKIRTAPTPDITRARGGVSRGLRAITERALRKEPAERYADCGEMAEALHRHFVSLNTSGKSLLPDPEAGRASRVTVPVPPPGRGATPRTVPQRRRGTPGGGGIVPGHVAPPEGRGGRRGFSFVTLLFLLALGGGGWYALSRGWVRIGDLGPGGESRESERPADGGGPTGGAMPTAGAMPDGRADAGGNRKAEPVEDGKPAGAATTPPRVEPPPAGGTDDDARAAAAVAAHLDAARSLADAGLLEKARDEAAEALKLVPDHPEAKRFLADVLPEIAAKRAEGDRAAEHRKWMDEALRLRLAGSLREAAAAYERAQASAPQGDTRASDAAAECLAGHFGARGAEAESKGELEQAAELYAKALEHSRPPAGGTVGAPEVGDGGRPPEPTGRRGRSRAELEEALARAKRKLEEQRAGEARRAEAARLCAEAEKARLAGDLDAALAAYREAAKREASVAARLRALEEEIARRNEAARRRAAYDAAMTRARSFARGRRWKEAAAACEVALRNRPGDREAEQLLAEARKHTTFEPALVLDLRGGVTMEFALIRAGEFTMGSAAREPQREADEGPARRVRLTRDFLLGRYEVTQPQYGAVMGEGRSHFTGPGNPAENVSWKDAKEFCRRLSEKTGRIVRLPTEAEWEYACRAGTTSTFHCGNSLSADQANIDGRRPYGAAAKGTFRGRTMPVGSFRPNARGLYDMHGNVWEWCLDCYDPDYYSKGPATDPPGRRAGLQCVLRGGAWSHSASYCRSANRYAYGPSERYDYVGLRVAIEVSEP